MHSSHLVYVYAFPPLVSDHEPPSPTGFLVLRDLCVPTRASRATSRAQTAARRRYPLPPSPFSCAVPFLPAVCPAPSASNDDALAHEALLAFAPRSVKVG